MQNSQIDSESFGHISVIMFIMSIIKSLQYDRQSSVLDIFKSVTCLFKLLNY